MPDAEQPSATLMPISLVPSVTETNMMFIITIPPTISAMEAIATITMKKVPLRFDQMLRKLSFVSAAKLSGLPGPSWRRARRIARTSSMADSNCAPTPLAFPEIRMLVCVPNCFRYALMGIAT